MALRFMSQIILAVAGLPVLHIKSFSDSVDTGRKKVKGMKPGGGSLGFTEGTGDITLELEAYIPADYPDIAWADITGATLLVVDKGLTGGGTMYLGCFTTKVGRKYEEEGQAMRSISMEALSMVEV